MLIGRVIDEDLVVDPDGPCGRELSSAVVTGELMTTTRGSLLRGQGMRGMRALSIRQPWAELILRGKKKIEYRSRPTRIRERVYIYASLGQVPRDDVDEVCENHGWPVPRDLDSLPRGVLVGTVEVVGCEEGDFGEYEWILARPKRLTRKTKPKKQPQPGFFWPF